MDLKEMSLKENVEKYDEKPEQSRQFMQHVEKQYTCCICNKKFTGYGNDPWPAGPKGSRCCDRCKWYVTLARMRGF